MMRRISISVFALALLAAFAFSQSSRNGEFAAQISKRSGAKNAREHNTWTAKIVDRAGATRYQIVKEIAFDMQYPAIYLADDGACLVSFVFNGVVEFYDGKGNLVRSIEPFGRKTNEHEQIIKCSIAGNRVALLCSTPEEHAAKLLVMDVHGNGIWRLTLKGKNVGEIFLSSDVKFIAAGSYEVKEKVFKTTEVFDASGKSVRSFDILFRNADIASDGRIALADRDNVILASLRDNAAPVKWSKSASNDVVTNVRFVNSLVAFSVETVNLPKGSPVYENPSLIVLNAKGKEVARNQLRSSSAKPSWLSIDNQRIMLNVSSTQSASIALRSLK